MLRKSKVRVEYKKVSDLINHLNSNNLSKSWAADKEKAIMVELGAQNNSTLDGYYYSVFDDKSTIPIQWSLFHESFSTIKECEKSFKKTYRKAYIKYWFKALFSVVKTPFKWKLIKLNFQQVPIQAIYSCGRFVGHKAGRLLNKKDIKVFFEFGHTGYDYSRPTGKIFVLKSK
jgi:hypothetical protein